MRALRKQAVIAAATFLMFFLTPELYAQENLQQRSEYDNAKVLNEYDINLLFKGADSIPRPGLLELDGETLYVFDRESGNLWKLGRDHEPVVLFTVEDEFDRHTLANVSAEDGFVIAAGAYNIYMYKDGPKKINNIYGLSYCVLHDGRLFATCKSIRTVLEDVDNFLFHEFDLDLNLLGAYVENDINIDNANMIKSFFYFTIFNNNIFVVDYNTVAIFYYDLSSEKCIAISADFPWAKDIIENNRKFVEAIINKDKNAGRGKSIVNGISLRGGLVYMLMTGYESAYIYSSDLKNAELEYVFPLSGFFLVRSFEVFNKDWKLYFLMIVGKGDDRRVCAFTEQLMKT